MDRFMLAHNPLRDEGFAHLYILHTANPRVLISVRPLEFGNQVGEESDDLRPGRVFRSHLIPGDFGTAVVSVEMDLQSGVKSKDIQLTPKLEIVLNSVALVYCFQIEEFKKQERTRFA